MIIINGLKWRIEYVPPFHPFLNDGRNYPALGCCDKTSQTICINDTIPIESIRLVLCHEIVHAAMYSYGIDLSYQEEELVAELISHYGEEIVSLTNIVYNNHSLKK